MMHVLDDVSCLDRVAVVHFNNKAQIPFYIAGYDITTQKYKCFDEKGKTVFLKKADISYFRLGYKSMLEAGEDIRSRITEKTLVFTSRLDELKFYLMKDIKVLMNDGSIHIGKLTTIYGGSEGFALSKDAYVTLSRIEDIREIRPYDRSRLSKLKKLVKKRVKITLANNKVYTCRYWTERDGVWYDFITMGSDEGMSLHGDEIIEVEELGEEPVSRLTLVPRLENDKDLPIERFDQKLAVNFIEIDTYLNSEYKRLGKEEFKKRFFFECSEWSIYDDNNYLGKLTFRQCGHPIIETTKDGLGYFRREVEDIWL